jgi:hypothetical protein
VSKVRPYELIIIDLRYAATAASLLSKLKVLRHARAAQHGRPGTGLQQQAEIGVLIDAMAAKPPAYRRAPEQPPFPRQPSDSALKAGI